MQAFSFLKIQKNRLGGKYRQHLKQFCCRGKEQNGVIAGEGWDFPFYLRRGKFREVKWLTRLTQLAWLTQEWHPGPQLPAPCPFLPTAAASCLWSSSGFLNTGLQVGPSTPTRISQFTDPWSRRDHPATSSHTWLNFLLFVLLLWCEISLQTGAWSCSSLLFCMLKCIQGPWE